MSLIHQVLQDLDQRNGMATSRPAGSMVLPTQTSKALYGKLVGGSLVIALAYGGYWLVSNYSVTNISAANTELSQSYIAPAISSYDESPQHDLSSKNLAAYIQGDKITTEIKLAKPVAVAVEIPVVEPPVLVDVVALSKPIKNVNPVAQNKTVDSTKIVPAKVQKQMNTDVAVKSAASDSLVSKNSKNTNTVIREESHQSLYRQAVRFSSLGQFQQANEILDQAIAIEPQISYIALKLRLFLEQKNADGFIQYYRQHNGTDSREWLTVAAPGLHMLGFYQEAAAAYERLIHQQPSVVNWPMAMSVALADAGEKERAKQVLAWLPERYRLTPKQRQWIAQKAEALH